MENLGLAFKENCPDLRNTKVMDLVEELRQFQVQVDICDPWVDAEEARHEYGVDLAQPEPGAYDAIVLAVGHRQFVEAGGEVLRAYGRPNAVLYDVKSVLPIDTVDGRL